MATARESKKSPDIAVLIAAGVAVVALVAWLVSWWAFSSEDEATQLTRVETTQTGAQNAEDRPRPGPPAAAPPAAAPPAVETPVAAERGEPPRSTPLASQDEPSASTRPGRQEAPKPRATEPAAKPHAVAPPEASAPKSPPVQTATRATPESGRRTADPVLEAMSGRYSGNYFDSSGGNTEMIGLTLLISSVDNGVVKATATLGGRGCHGDYPMQGTYQNKTLNLRATRKGGPAGDCPLNLALAVEGDRLAGTADNGDKVQLTK